MTLLLCVGAIVRRSPKSLLVVQAVLFVVGFLHVEWIMGWIPEKIDPRVFETALIAHAIAWSSVLCGVAALVVCLRIPKANGNSTLSSPPPGDSVNRTTEPSRRRSGRPSLR